MARFIEDRAAPGWVYVFLIPGTLAGMMFAAYLFAHEVISTLGFIGLLGLVVVSVFLIDEHVRRHYRREIEITPGKKAAQVPETLDAEVQEFRSDSSGIAFVLVIVLLPLYLIWLLSLWIVTRDAARAASLLVQALPFVLILTVLLLTVRRVRVGRDHVQVIHPFFRARRDRTINLSDIDSVELKEIGRGGTEVRIATRDGNTLLFRTSDAKKSAALMGALKRRVAQSKPFDPVWSDLA